MNYIDNTLTRISGILLDNKCNLCHSDLQKIGFIIANAMLVSTIDPTVVKDVVQLLDTLADDEIPK